MNNIIKTTAIILSTIGFATASYATTPGVYLGGGLGISSLADFSDADKSGNNTGLGGRVFIGYNFTQYIGVEAGYNKYADTSYALNDDTNFTFDYELYTLDALAKLYLPLTSINPALDVYALGGVASAYGSVSNVQYYGYGAPSTSNNTFVAMVGLGAQYAITPHLTTALEYTLTGGTSGDSENLGIPQSSLVTLNVAYQIGALG
jgi:OOP family OmpA-OmpF porin